MAKLSRSALPVALTVLLGTALLATGSAAKASTIGGFTDLYLFGDSLTDTGNFHALTGQVGGLETFDRPYYNGRRSNGPLWSDYIEADFEAEGLTAKNYAWIGATAVPDGDFIPDLPAQIGQFALSGAPLSLDDRPLAGLWFGANDVLEGVDAGTAQASGIAAANAVADGALALASFGIQDFLVFNLPDLGQTPYLNLYEGTSIFPQGAKAAAASGSAAFNSTIATRIGELRTAGYNVIDIDMAALFDALLADPTQFGLEDATLPCLFLPGTGAFFGQPDTCGGGEALDRAFYDWLHPNSVVHAQIADVVRKAGVMQDPIHAPLPAPAFLLLGGLAALVTAARRGSHVRSGA